MSTAKKIRDVQRSVHLVASAMLLVHLYTPLGDDPVFDVMLRAILVPALTVSGLLMWQWRRLRTALRSRRGLPATLRGRP